MGVLAGKRGEGRAAGDGSQTLVGLMRRAVCPRLLRERPGILYRCYDYRGGKVAFDLSLSMFHGILWRGRLISPCGFASATDCLCEAIAEDEVKNTDKMWIARPSIAKQVGCFVDILLFGTSPLILEHKRSGLLSTA